MRIKRLEIQGFKSFKDRTVIHFDHGITGIVGPNGCGKSNIVDAFFWVMGEQSYKHMRGSGSDDLIFNGSSRYNPLGMAEATLVMETGEVDPTTAPTGASSADEEPKYVRTKEISVTRRLYRGGEGEYFVNGQPARLKDIHELFMDTGVGAKGYSVIEQGQIAKVVNAKPEDRRLLVEEAAGIAKYKARKKESLRKMEATQANLARLNDIIQEIERGLASLERQAQKARSFRKYKEELLDKELTWGRRKSTVLKAKIENLRAQHTALEQDLVGLRAELQTAENAIEVDRVDQVTDAKRAEELQAIVERLAGELTERRSALDLARRRQGDLATQVASLQSEAEQIRQGLEGNRAALEAQTQESAQAAALYEQAAQTARNDQAQAQTARQSSQEASRRLEESRQRLMREVQQASDLQSRSAALKSRQEATASQIARLEEQAQELASQSQALQTEAEAAQAAYQSAVTRRDALREERRSAQVRIQELERTAREQDQVRDRAQREWMQIKSRLQSLEELAAAHEGFGEGPKRALAHARTRQYPATALAEMLDVPTGLEGAVQATLESHLQSVLIGSPDQAMELLNSLRDEGKGRAELRFNAQVTGRRSAAPTEALARLGLTIIGTASTCIRVRDGELAQAARQALEGTLFVESLAPAQSAIDQLIVGLNGWSVASRDGQFLSSEGILRGGSASEEGPETAILRRKAEIQKLTADTVQAEARHAEAEQSAQAARQQIELARAQQASLQAELQTCEIEGATLERDVQQAERRLRETALRQDAFTSDLRRASTELESCAAELEQVALRMETLTSGRGQLEASISELDQAVTTLTVKLREAESREQESRIQEASLRERMTSVKRELEASRMLVADRERRLAEIERTLARATNEKSEHSGGETGLETRIAELTRELGTAREGLSQVKDRMEGLSAKLNSGLERIKALHRAGDEKTTQSTQAALELEKASGEFAHLIQSLEEKYGPGCLDQPSSSGIQEEMTDPVVTREMTAEEEQLLSEEVERLRERIRRLGEVNTAAVEEFEEAQKRHQHLVNERADLETSMKNLEQAIEHINKTSEERFKKAFEAISERFTKLFPIIFGGGSAHLSLVYPEGSQDILDAGVDIMAQPPGKKVSNIGLLSGGEKALTAVSMIFAIFMVKPSPFCILDEVDAPLDDSNVGKFNALLREMSSKSQFILITHNKKTMELNDTLYGVTMEEPGVSKMVSIELQ